MPNPRGWSRQFFGQPFATPVPALLVLKTAHPVTARPRTSLGIRARGLEDRLDLRAGQHRLLRERRGHGLNLGPDRGFVHQGRRPTLDPRDNGPLPPGIPEAEDVDAAADGLEMRDDLG